MMNKKVWYKIEIKTVKNINTNFNANWYASQQKKNSSYYLNIHTECD